MILNTKTLVFEPYHQENIGKVHDGLFDDDRLE